jgi:putative endonuclease
MARHNEIGKQGEDLAVEYLEKQGFRIFDRNYNFEKGEVDIVAYWENPENPAATAQLHFIEVKTLTDSRFRKPEDAVDQDKMRNMAKVASFYLYERQLVTLPTVFSVIAVALDIPEIPEIVFYEDVFRPEGPY